MTLFSGSQKGTSYILLTPSICDQIETEDECRPFFVDLNSLPASQIEHLRHVGMISPNAYVNDDDEDSSGNEDLQASVEIRLLREKHRDYLMSPFTSVLHSSYLSLDSSRPWIVYWCLQGLDLLGYPLSENDANRVIRTLRTCLSYDGELAGFSGGPLQMGHCAPNYAAVLALCIIGGSTDVYSPATCSAAYDAIDRKAMYAWFLSLRRDYSVRLKSGKFLKRIGYRMHHDGEVDCRGTYTVLCIAKLLNILTEELTDGVAEYIVSCQTYEGGFGAEFDNEAHGGYTYCAVAARMQMKFEGGFAGRTNKLVDGCYTFWQGAAMAILNIFDDARHLSDTDLHHIPSSGITEKVIEVDLSSEIDLDEVMHINEKDNLSGGLMFNQGLLQRYTLLCAQCVNGGLRDKPSKPRDFYHSCYNLSGLSVAQHVLSENGVPIIYGDPSNRNVLKPTHPVFNIQICHVDAAVKHFSEC